MEERPELDALVSAAVRRELSRVGRRYAPLVLGAVVFALIVAFVPTVNSKGPGRADVAAGVSPGAAGGGAGNGTTAAGETGAGGAATTGTATGGTTGGSGGAAAGPASGATSGMSSTGSVGPAAAVAPATGSASGVARSGVTCGPGAKQVTFSHYAPPCIAKFEAGNGGATSHGVTQDTITVTYRRGQSTQDTAVYAAAADAAPGPDNDFLYDMRAYADLFNRTYELYGRHVVIKDFQGQGDYIQEDMGQGQANAAADAATARDLGAFADATFLLKGSRPFWEGLARQKVVAIGPLGFPQSWFARNAPYWWSVGPTGSQGAQFVVNGVCRRLGRLSAAFAGDPLYQRTQRVFGLITPENPEYMEIGNEIQNGLKACGLGLARRASYSINVATFQAQATNVVAQFKAAGVTTAICFCDPLVPIFLSQAADQQQYRPEWTEPWYRDPQGRLMSQDQWAHAIANGAALPAKTQSEAYRVFKLAKPNEEPKEQYYDVAYYTMLYLFNGLQAAGPSLTPQTFARGLFSLPTTERGDVGPWRYGQNIFSPTYETQIGWWSANATSSYDGKKGAWLACEGGAWFAYDKPEAWGQQGTQLRCFGK